ncbi:MAG TPA: LysM peptidoglycan-binding domain-containing protein [Acidimicrobiales bacterium]|nr:LysM peptidoglycan-binding domain-containing protein [Acidimicrobiales bacterium]
MSDARARLGGLAATLGLAAVVVGPPLALAHFVGWPLPRSVPHLDQLALSARSGVDDQVVVKILAVLAWLLWAQIALAAAVELAALFRGRDVGRAPVLSGVQVGVARMVAVAALAFAGLGTRSTTASPAQLAALVAPAPPVPADPPPTEAPVAPSAPSSPAAAPAAPVPAAAAGETHVVRQGESWWEIAERLMGSGFRWQELRAANAGRVMPGGQMISEATNAIRPGWPLVVPGRPSTPAAAADDEVVVRRGDNLWSITERQLAEADGSEPATAEVRETWAEVIELNRDRVADPDVIFAGQVLRFPASHHPAPVPVKPAPNGNGEPPAPPTASASPAPAPGASTAAQAPAAPAPADTAPADTTVSTATPAPGDKTVPPAPAASTTQRPDRLRPLPEEGSAAAPSAPATSSTEGAVAAGAADAPAATAAAPAPVPSASAPATAPLPDASVSPAPATPPTPERAPITSTPPTADPAALPAPGPTTIPTSGPLPATTAPPASLAPPDASPPPAPGGGAGNARPSPPARPVLRPAAHDGGWRSGLATSARVLGAAATMVAVGVGSALARRRLRRAAGLPRRAIPPPPPPDLDGLRAELCLEGDVDAADRLHRALRDVARALAAGGSEARPRLVQTSPGRVEVLLSAPVVPAPAGWRAEASGNAWSLTGEPRDTDGDGPAPAPVLVSVGRPDEAAEVHLDLEAEGVVSLVGEAEAVAGVARSWVLELATSPLAAGANVVVVGDVVEVPDEGERVRRAGSWGEVLGDASAWVTQTAALLGARRWPTPFAGRVGAHDDGLAPLVLVGPGEAGIEELCAAVLEGHPAVTLVVIGTEVAGSTAVEVTGEELAVPALGLRCRAQAVAAEGLEQVEALLADASEIPGQLSFLPRPEVSAPVAIGGVDDEYHDPPHSVLVRLLGDIEVVGGTRRLRPQETAVVAYIALYGPVGADQVEDAVWSFPTASRRKRLANTISACRGALGNGVLPSADGQGRYKTSSDLLTDLELFRRRLAYAAGQRPEAAVATLRGALELVTGKVFSYRGGERSSFVWVDVDNWEATWGLTVTEAAEDLVGRCRDLGDLDTAVWAARRGLAACPTHRRLTDALIDILVARGDTESARSVAESYQAVMQQFEMEDLAGDVGLAAGRGAAG